MSEKLKSVLITESNNDFKEHFDNNKRIIFSAPFGVGKTYFLNEFFDRPICRGKYEVFTIHPVNYCTADNKDIYELIKYDLIGQLVDKNYIKGRYDKGYDPDINDKRVFNLLCEGLNIVSLGQSKKVTDSIKTAYKILKEIKHSNKEIEKTEDNEALRYRDNLGEEKGLYLEMNIISRLIKDKIEEISKEKETVLVIEDLDRLDPAHIFRLLNIFSSYDDLDTRENKFGFSKIIFVCDIDNIREIYRHFYGPNTDFDGYISKFYDAGPFRYYNYLEMRRYIRAKLGLKTGRSFSRNLIELGNTISCYILENAIINDLIDFRDLRHLETIDIKSYLYKEMKPFGSLFVYREVVGDNNRGFKFPDERMYKEVCFLLPAIVNLVLDVLPFVTDYKMIFQRDYRGYSMSVGGYLGKIMRHLNASKKYYPVTRRIEPANEDSLTSIEESDGYNFLVFNDMSHGRFDNDEFVEELIRIAGIIRR